MMPCPVSKWDEDADMKTKQVNNMQTGHTQFLEVIRKKTI